MFFQSAAKEEAEGNLIDFTLIIVLAFVISL